MCGPDLSNKPRYGALAVVNPPSSSPPSSPLSPSDSASPLSGSLSLFSSTGVSSLVATQATFALSPSSPCSNSTGDVGLSLGQRYSVIIHDTGDLTLPTSECAMFRRFEFCSGSVAPDGLSMATELEEPLRLEVGGDGVIGRRVSVFVGSSGDGRGDAESDESQHGALLVAEGVVGINQVLVRI